MNKVYKFPDKGSSVPQPKTDIDPELEHEIERIHIRFAKLQKSISKKMESPAAILTTLKYLLRASLNMVPLAEEDYRRSRKGMYAFISLGNQIRELMIEIRQTAGGSDTADYLLEEIMVPALQMVLQHVMNDFSFLRKELAKSLPPQKMKRINESINTVLQNYATLMEETSNQVRENVNKYVAGK